MELKKEIIDIFEKYAFHESVFNSLCYFKYVEYLDIKYQIIFNASTRKVTLYYRKCNQINETTLMKLSWNADSAEDTESKIIKVIEMVKKAYKLYQYNLINNEFEE